MDILVGFVFVPPDTGLTRLKETDSLTKLTSSFSTK